MCHYHLAVSVRLKVFISSIHKPSTSFGLHTYPHKTRWYFLAVYDGPDYRNLLLILFILSWTQQGRIKRDMQYNGEADRTELNIMILPPADNNFPFNSPSFLSSESKIRGQSCLDNLSGLMVMPIYLMGNVASSHLKISLIRDNELLHFPRRAKALLWKLIFKPDNASFIFVYTHWSVFLKFFILRLYFDSNTCTCFIFL